MPRKQYLPKDNRIKLTELSPDGIRILVDWGKFPVGASVFVPVIDSTRLRKQLQDVANALQFTVEVRNRIEDGKLGVRIWRIL